MDIEQIDLSCDFAKLQNAGGKEKREIYNRIADKLEHVFSILSYEDTLYSNETRNEQIYGKKSCSNINTVSQADAKDQNSQHPKDDLKSTGNALVEIFKNEERKREQLLLPIIEQIFGKNELKDPLEQKFSFDGESQLFSENSRKKLREFGTSFSEYGNSIINKRHSYNEPEVNLYNEGVFEKGDDANRTITDFLTWRKENKPETLFTFFQEHELWNWGHASSFNGSNIESRNSRNWKELIFSSDLSKYEYRGLSASWHEDGHSFQYIIETFWSMQELHFLYDDEFLIVSDQNKRQLKLTLSTFLNLFLAAPGEDLWHGGPNTESFFQELIESGKLDNVSYNLEAFSLSLINYFKVHGAPPRVDLISCWESIGSITCLNHSNNLNIVDLWKRYEEHDSNFSLLISSLNDHIPILIPYYILGEFFKSEYDTRSFEYNQFNKGFILDGSDDSFSANKFIQERLTLYETLKALEFDLISEAIMILTVTDLLILGETKALNWKHIFSLLETRNFSRSTKQLILQLFNEHPQDKSENLRRFRAQFKAELEEADPNVQIIKDCLLKGESKYVEFKQTLSWDINTKTKEKRIEESALKAICGFLNADGGTLLIGVSDQGQALGIDFEIKKLHKNEDKFSLHLKNLIKDRLGSGALTQVDHKIVNFNETKIVVIECPKSEKETWLDKKEFYVRSHPSTDRLDGPELLQYCRERFNS